MDQNERLEHQFDAEMIDIFNGAARLGTGSTRLRGVVRQHGGLATAHQFLAADKVQDGCAELLLLGRLDLTVEHHDLLTEYSLLFAEEERRVARARLGTAQPGKRPR